jgi:uncharacterized membrane protein
VENAPARRAAGPIAIGDHPIYPMLLPVPIVGFTGAILTDLAYRSTAQMLWQNFSVWLITGGLVVGAIAAIVLLIDFLSRGAVRRSTAGRIHALLFAAALIAELFNAFVHSRDGWTAVVPAGLTLSIVGTLLILISGWLWQSARTAVEVRP